MMPQHIHDIHMNMGPLHLDRQVERVGAEPNDDAPF